MLGNIRRLWAYEVALWPECWGFFKRHVRGSLAMMASTLAIGGALPAYSWAFDRQSAWAELGPSIVLPLMGVAIGALIVLVCARVFAPVNHHEKQRKAIGTLATEAEIRRIYAHASGLIRRADDFDLEDLAREKYRSERKGLDQWATDIVIFIVQYGEEWVGQAGPPSYPWPDPPKPGGAQQVLNLSGVRKDMQRKVACLREVQSWHYQRRASG